MLALSVAVLFTQAALHTQAASPTHCGIVYHLVDGSADGIRASYSNRRFALDTLSTLPIRRQLQGRSSLGKAVTVVVDSANSSDEPFASQYHVRVNATARLDTTEAALFCDHPLPITIEFVVPGHLDSAGARAVRLRISALHRAALVYDPEVFQHDSLEYRTSTILQPVAAPTIRIVSYQITLIGALPGQSDERASGFAIYSTTAKRVLYATFGHPEWAPSAETVDAIYPRIFFSLRGDPRLYLLASYDGPWESYGGQWVIFDVRRGNPITVPDLGTGGRFR